MNINRSLRHLALPRKLLFYLIFLLVALLLSGCGPLIRQDQSQVDGKLTVSAGHSAGQTFVASYDGLDAVRILLEPVSSGPGKLVLHLRPDPTSTQNIASASLSISKIQEKGYYSLSFPAQPYSRRQYYAVTLEVQGEGEVAIFSGPASAYLDGALYEEGVPQEAQMAFGLEYYLPQAVAGLARLGLTWLGILLAGLFLFSLPGWALLTGLWRGWGEQPWPAKLALASGLGLGIYPLLMLWTSLAGLRLGAVYAWLPPLAALLFLAERLFRKIRAGGQTRHTSLRLQVRNYFRNSSDLLADIAFLIVMALIVFTRFWAIRNLDAAMWGDGMQHTMIAQLIVDNGGLFNSWQPYAELQTLTYHFGFHSQVAALHWISGIPVIDATLWTGQIVNILAVLAIYPLAVKVGRNRWAGVAGVLIAGLLAQMPMSYVNWGRYTQLAGQAILPVAILLAWDLLDWQLHDWRLTILGWIAWGGLALIHYRILIFAILFLPAFLLLSTRRKEIRPHLTRLLALGSGAGLLFLPWFLHVFGGRILSNTAQQLSTPAQALGEYTQGYNSIGDIFTYLPAWLWLLLVLAMGWMLWKQKRFAAIIAFWWFLILIAANPQWLNLPGAGAISNFAVFIAAYIPAGIIIGAAAGDLLQSLTCIHIPKYIYFPAVASLTAAILLAILGIWGARLRLQDVQISSGAMVTQPDVRAGEWIRANLPEDARFLINGFPAYGNSVYVGSDGGWWLPLLADRQAAIPPLNYGTEQGPNADYVRDIFALYQQLQDRGVTDPASLQLLLDQGIDYLYIGQQQGSVNASDPALLDPVSLESDSHFQFLYHQDRVWIFQVTKQVGGE